MSWTDDLAQQIREAIDSHEPCTIEVDSDARVELGKIAAERLAHQRGGDASMLTFIVAADTYDN